MEHRHSPFLGDMHIGQIEDLAHRLNGWKRSLVFDDLAQLAIVTFNVVGGVKRESPRKSPVLPSYFPRNAQRWHICGPIALPAWPGYGQRFLDWATGKWF